MPVLQLVAGPLTVHYEAGFLRYVKHREAEILRMIYFALRDANWGTYPLVKQDEHIEQHPEGFRVSYTAESHAGTQALMRWHVLINGNRLGEISFSLEGIALADVWKNRAGLCVLHPIADTAGALCKVFHPGGRVEHSVFPLRIAPENPFTNVEAFVWDCRGATYRLDFTGDVFETEDQRNWTDASFKTFCTPLSLPRPVLLPEGSRVQQSVRFSIIESAVDRTHQVQAKAKKQISQQMEIGIGASTETDALTADAIELLRALHLRHYRIEVAPGTPNWQHDFEVDCYHAALLGLHLEIALHLPDQSELALEDFIKVCQHQQPALRKVLLLSAGQPATTQRVVDLATRLRPHLPGALIGAGTDYNFAELNRNRFDAEALDFVSFSIHPQEHAFDDFSLLETIEAQADTITSAQAIYPRCQIHVSPVTLRKRFNPYAITAQDRALTNQQRADPRQTTDFAALWTERCVDTLAAAGAHSITLFQTVGKQGLIEQTPFPVYFAVKKLIQTHRGR